MVGIPTVKSFCGCCALRIPCIVLASIRMIAYVAGVLAFLYFFIVLDLIFKDKQNRNFKDENLDIIIRVLLFVVSVNTFISILFIVGVKSRNPTKMEYYVVVLGLNALLFVFLFKIIFAIFAVIDCFILLVSYSLYKEYSCQDGTLMTDTTVDTAITNENDPSLPSAKENRL